MAFKQVGTVITEYAPSAFDSGTTYVEGDLVAFSDVVYSRNGAPETPKGVKLTFGTNNTVNNKTDKLTFDQVIGDGQSVLGFNNNNNVPTPGTPFTFGDTRFYREKPALSLADKITNWSGQINTDGILESIFTSTTIELYNQDGTDIEVNPTLAGAFFDITIDAVQPNKTLTSGNPDVDTDHWTSTTLSPTGDTLAEVENVQLSGLDGVTYSGLGNSSFYELADTVTFVTEGELTIDGEYSQVIVTNTVKVPSGASADICKFDIADGGILNLGVKKSGLVDASGSDIYSGGTPLFIPAGIENNAWYSTQDNSTVGSHFGISPGGTLNINGCTVRGKLIFKPCTGATINNVYPAKIIIDGIGQAEGQELLIRWKSPTINATSLSIEGGQVSYDVPNVKVTINKTTGGIAFWNQATNAAANMSNTDPDGNFQIYENCGSDENTVGFAGYTPNNNNSRHKGSMFRGLNGGSYLDNNGGQTGGTAAQNAATYLIGTRVIDTNLISLVDGSNVPALIYMGDTNRYSDLSDPIEEVLNDGVDYFNDDSQFTYIGFADGSLTSLVASGGFGAGVLLESTSVNEVALYTFQLNFNPAILRVRGTRDVGIWKRDIRSKSGVPGTDDFDFHLWPFETNYKRHEAILTGKGTYTIDEAFTEDTRVSRTLAEIAAATAIVEGTVAYSGSTINFSNERTLDDVYDVLKYEKSTQTSAINIPSPDKLVVNSEAGILDFNDKTISYSTGATLSIGIKHGGIKHDSTLDLANLTMDDMSVDAPSLTGLPNSIPSGAELIGTFSDTLTGEQTYDFNSNVDVDQFTFAASSSSTITIKGKPFSAFAVPPVNNGSGSIVFDADNATRFTVPSGTVTGWATLVNITDSSIVSELKHTSGTETLLASVDNVSSGAKEYLIIYRPQATATAIYQASFSPRTSNNAFSNTTISPIIVSHADALTNDAENHTKGTENAILRLPTALSTTAFIDVSGSRDVESFLSAAGTLKVLLTSLDTSGLKGVWSPRATMLVSSVNTTTGFLLQADVPIVTTNYLRTPTGLELERGVDYTVSADIDNEVFTVSLLGSHTISSLGAYLHQTGWHFGKYVEVLSDNVSTYNRLIANVGFSTGTFEDFVVPGANSTTLVDSDVIQLNATHQNYLTGVINSGDKTLSVDLSDCEEPSVVSQSTIAQTTIGQTTSAVKPLTDAIEVKVDEVITEQEAEKIYEQNLIGPFKRT